MQAKLMNMCMIEDNNGNVLVQERIKSWNGIAFPGGKVEGFEGIIESTIREIKEETGLDIKELKLCGLKTWVKDINDITNVVACYKTNNYSGELIKESAEGKHYWVKKDEIKKLKLAEGFDLTLELFLNEDVSEILWKQEEGKWCTKVYK